MLIDTRSVNITGKEAEHVLDSIGITVNKNAIPFDPTSPFVTSGIQNWYTCCNFPWHERRSYGSDR
ncbi:hypothetical protein MT997_00005 [Paenibacillus sp. OVF10]|nr:hypothetical protein MT997_00005 [Paenibacillus sp. OVF10]